MATFLKCDGCDTEIPSDRRTLARVKMLVTTTEDQEFIPVPARRDAPGHFDLCPNCLKQLERAIDPRNFARGNLESDLSAVLKDHGFSAKAA